MELKMARKFFYFLLKPIYCIKNYLIRFLLKSAADRELNDTNYITAYITIFSWFSKA